jgi:hypothetical protein
MVNQCAARISYMIMLLKGIPKKGKKKGEKKTADNYENHLQ